MSFDRRKEQTICFCSLTLLRAAGNALAADSGLACGASTAGGAKGGVVILPAGDLLRKMTQGGAGYSARMSLCVKSRSGGAEYPALNESLENCRKGQRSIGKLYYRGEGGVDNHPREVRPPSSQIIYTQNKT